MKKGTNNSDRKHIARLCEEGLTPEQISKALLIDLDVVKAFLPEKQAKAAKKTKERKEKNDAEHKEIMDKKNNK